MANADFIIVDRFQERAYRNRRCAKCGKSFVMGDKGHSHTTRQSRKVYHKKCWESMLY